MTNQKVKFICNSPKNNEAMPWGCAATVLGVFTSGVAFKLSG